MFNENKQGWKVLISAAILQIFLGVIYIWSIFVLPVTETLSWTEDAAKLTASFMIGFFSLALIYGGKLQVKICASKVVVIGGLMMVGGMAAAGLTPPAAPWLLYITYGVIAGFGAGMGYIASITAAQKWFPKRRGFATGLCVGAFGVSVSIFAPIIRHFLVVFDNDPRPIFLLLAGTFLVAVLLLGPKVKFPEQTAAAVIGGDKKQYTTKEALRTKEFYLIATSIFLITVAFFVLNPAFQTLSMARGFDAAFATTLIVITGLSNTLGRVIIPVLSSRIGNEKTILVLMVANAVAAAFLIFADGVPFVIMASLITFCFGASLSVFPLITADYFGIANLGANYGAVMIGFALSSLVMPGVIGLLGGYTVMFIAVTVLSGIGILCVISLIAAGRKKNKIAA